MNISVPNPEKNYKVLVRCITYNHSKFICDALNGFSIQKTNFPFICIVVDDASKDGNQDVIKQYANDNCDMSKSEISEDDISIYIRVPHKINLNCVFLFCLLKLNLYGKPEKQEIYKSYRVACKYEAMCEGDDYWIDSQKLQVQVDFLDKFKDYGVCITDFNILYQKDKKIKEFCFNKYSKKFTEPTTLKDWIVNNRYVAPMTWLVRTDLVIGARNSSPRSPDGTYVYMAYYLAHSKVKCIKNRCTAVYRYVGDSITHSGSLEATYKRIMGLYRAKINLASMYFSNQEFNDLISKINKKHYNVGLYLFVALNKTEDIQESKKWLTQKTLKNKVLYVVAKIPLLQKMFKLVYHNVLYSHAGK